MWFFFCKPACQRRGSLWENIFKLNSQKNAVGLHCSEWEKYRDPIYGGRRHHHLFFDSNRDSNAREQPETLLSFLGFFRSYCAQRETLVDCSRRICGPGDELRNRVSGFESLWVRFLNRLNGGFTLFWCILALLLSLSTRTGIVQLACNVRSRDEPKR